VIKSRRIRFMGYVPCLIESRNTKELETLTRGKAFDALAVNWRATLKHTLKKQNMRVQAGVIRLRIWTSGGL
jgi:hypothetical protein